jgi:glycerate-2-kinase
MMRVKNASEIVSNAKNGKAQKARKILVELVDAVVKAVDPYLLIKSNIKVDDEELRVKTHCIKMSGFERIFVFGGGKAVLGMAKALEDLFGERISGGVIIAPEWANLKKVEVIKAGHPIPTEEGVKGTKKMFSLLDGVNEKDLILCLISGGGSSLLCLPPEDVSLEDLQKTTDLLLKSGATIHEINTVRKHLSQINGGRLAAKTQPAKLVSLIISDVIGNEISTIASGPTAPDSTTYKDALLVLKKYGVLEKAPDSVLEHLKRGAMGKIPDTPKPSDPLFKNVLNVILADNSDALAAAEIVGKQHSLNVHMVSKNMFGEARKFGRQFALISKKLINSSVPVKKPALLLCGGETTVKVIGGGKGGRNQELVLSAALQIDGLDAAIASFGTDGIDGPTDAAGAIADGFTVQRAKVMGLDPLSFLQRNDSYNFFKHLGDLIITGFTGTNVMDVASALIF